MKKEWISPKVIIWKDATGSYYFKRYDVEQEIEEVLSAVLEVIKKELKAFGY